MKSYTFYDTGKNGGLTQINFKVPEEGIILTSGPLAREGVYRIDGDRIIKDSNNYDSFVVNCIDIDWNECLVDANTTIKTTADLIRWIRQIVKNAGSFDPANFSLDGSILYYGKRDDPSRIKIYDDSESTPWLDDLDWITTNMIKDNAITTPKLADRSVTEPKLANNAVSTRTIQNGAVTGDKLASEILEYTPNGTSNTTTTFGTLKLGNNNQVDITYKGALGSGGIADLGGSEYVPEDENGPKLGTLNLKTSDNTELASIDIYGKKNETDISELNDLDDVTITTPLQEKLILKYNGEKWVNEAFKLSDLDGVTVTNPQEEQVLKYDGTKWINGVGGKTYTAGEGIEIDAEHENKISLKEASNEKLGGIKLGYIENGKNYPVQTFEGKAYVNVPWITGDDLAVGKMYMQAFKTTDTKTPIPDLPGDQFPNGNDGWKQYAENNDATQFVWMATRLMDSTGSWIDDSWNGPWLITGPQGEAGADGKDIEFIYRRNNDPSSAPEGSNNLTGTVPNSNGIRQTVTLTNATYKTTDDFVPDNWNDNPTGISLDMRCEWMCIRTKTNNEWSPFIGPVLWSRWGQNGVDGDGVEYIFYASSNGTISVGLYPNEWSDTSTEVGKNGKKFLDREYLGPNNSLWVDNPIDLDKSGYGQGSKEWVSIRKWNRQTEKWGKFSEPALWTYYPKNGISEGYTVDLTNETMPIGTTTGGVVKNYSNTCGVQVFHNGESITSGYTITIGTITGSKNNIGISNVSASLANNIITVTINSTGLTGFAGEYFTIPVTVRLSNGTEYKKSITGYGLSVGEPGTSMELVAGASVIRVNYDLTICAPSILSPLAKVIKKDSNGNDTVVMYNPLSANPSSSNPFDFYYLYLGSSNSTSTRLTTNSITIGLNYKTYDGILISLKYYNTTIDNEYIPFVRDGAPGIGISPITYRIQPVSTDLKCYYVNDTQKVSGFLRFRIFKDVYERDTNGNTTLTSTALTSSNNKKWWGSVEATETIDLKVGGIAKTPSYYSSSATNYWEINISDSEPLAYDNIPFSSITLNSSTTVLASIVVPFVMLGKDGKLVSGLQSLIGTVIRFKKYIESTDVEYWDGLESDNDGVYYLDVVEYEGSYFRPKNYVNYSHHNNYKNLGDPIINGKVNSNWELFAPAGASAFLYLIANNAYILNLTVKNAVVTQNDKVVAGLVSGSYLTKDTNTGLYVSTNDLSGSTYNSNGVRIFAGTPINANLTTCPFYVDSEGAGQLAGGKINWNKTTVNNLDVWNLNIQGGITTETLYTTKPSTVNSNSSNENIKINSTDGIIYNNIYNGSGNGSTYFGTLVKTLSDSIYISKAAIFGYGGSNYGYEDLTILSSTGLEVTSNLGLGVDVDYFLRGSEITSINSSTITLLRGDYNVTLASIYDSYYNDSPALELTISNGLSGNDEIINYVYIKVTGIDFSDYYNDASSRVLLADGTTELISNLGGNNNQTRPTADTLADLSDVSISNLSSGQILSYNGSNWENSTTLELSGLKINGELKCGTPSYLLTIDTDDVSVTFDYDSSNPIFEFNGDITTKEISINNNSDSGTISLGTDVDGKYFSVKGSNRISLGTNLKWDWIELMGNDDEAYIRSDLVVSGTVTDNSDATLKDIVSDTTLTVEQVANAPAVNFTWKKNADKEDKKVNVGTLALYWNVVLPEVVKENKDGKLSMAYGNAAMISSIVTAKEVVALKQENEDLKQRISQLEEWVNNLRNSLNN